MIIHNYNINVLIILIIYSFQIILLAQYNLNIFFKLHFGTENIYYQLHDLGLKCLKESNSVYGYNHIPYHTKEERYTEYIRLLNLTVKARQYPIHSWLGFNGPWIEDVWISTFCCSKDISEFGPYIPVFIPWLNIYKRGKGKYSKRATSYLNMLKPDFLYITVVQSDYGIEGNISPLQNVPSNLLIISPSGKGHIPTLLYMKEQNFVDPLPKNNTILFIGNLKRHKRYKIVKNFQKFFGNKISVFTEKVEDWKSLYRSYDLILSPRGNARGCFRTSEVLLMGLIPILAFDDHLWVPYLNSSLPWNDIGFYLLSKDVDKLVDVVNKLTPERISFMRNSVRKYRDSHFTMNATMNQISLFMKYGYKKSDLRCDRYYSTN